MALWIAVPVVTVVLFVKVAFRCIKNSMVFLEPFVFGPILMKKTMKIIQSLGGVDLLFFGTSLTFPDTPRLSHLLICSFNLSSTFFGRLVNAHV